MNQILNIQDISSCRNKRRAVSSHLRVLNIFYTLAWSTDKKNVIHPKAAVRECSGVCSFRQVDCQKFLIRAIIKELWRLFSTESHCLIAECTHTEYRWRMCSVGWRLHANHWQLHRNLPIRHVMHKPKNTLKMNVNQRVKVHAYTPSSRDQICIISIKEFHWMGLLGFVEGFLWFGWLAF